jgi:hypothetical protein
LEGERDDNQLIRVNSIDIDRSIDRTFQEAGVVAFVKPQDKEEKRRPPTKRHRVVAFGKTSSAYTTKHARVVLSTRWRPTRAHAQPPAGPSLASSPFSSSWPSSWGCACCCFGKSSSAYTSTRVILSTRRRPSPAPHPKPPTGPPLTPSPFRLGVFSLYIDQL